MYGNILIWTLHVYVYSTPVPLLQVYLLITLTMSLASPIDRTIYRFSHDDLEHNRSNHRQKC